MEFTPHRTPATPRPRTELSVSDISSAKDPQDASASDSSRSSKKKSSAPRARELKSSDAWKAEDPQIFRSPFEAENEKSGQDDATASGSSISLKNKSGAPRASTPTSSEVTEDFYQSPFQEKNEKSDKPTNLEYSNFKPHLQLRLRTAELATASAKKKSKFFANLKTKKTKPLSNLLSDRPISQNTEKKIDRAQMLRFAQGEVLHKFYERFKEAFPDLYKNKSLEIGNALNDLPDFDTVAYPKAVKKLFRKITLDALAQQSSLATNFDQTQKDALADKMADRWGLIDDALSMRGSENKKMHLKAATQEFQSFFEIELSKLATDDQIAALATNAAVEMTGLLGIELTALQQNAQAKNVGVFRSGRTPDAYKKLYGPLTAASFHVVAQAAKDAVRKDYVELVTGDTDMEGLPKNPTDEWLKFVSDLTTQCAALLLNTKFHPTLFDLTADLFTQVNEILKSPDQTSKRSGAKRTIVQALYLRLATPVISDFALHYPEGDLRRSAVSLVAKLLTTLINEPTEEIKRGKLKMVFAGREAQLTELQAKVSAHLTNFIEKLDAAER